MERLNARKYDVLTLISTEGVNFINILLNPFLPIFLSQKLQSQNVTREKLCKPTSNKIFAREMFMKLTLSTLHKTSLSLSRKPTNDNCFVIFGEKRIFVLHFLDIRAD